VKSLEKAPHLSWTGTRGSVSSLEDARQKGEDEVDLRVKLEVLVEVHRLKGETLPTCPSLLLTCFQNFISHGHSLLLPTHTGDQKIHHWMI
jgi:hypothetical protein